MLRSTSSDFARKIWHACTARKLLKFQTEGLLTPEGDLLVESAHKCLLGALLTVVCKIGSSSNIEHATVHHKKRKMKEIKKKKRRSREGSAGKLMANSIERTGVEKQGHSTCHWNTLRFWRAGEKVTSRDIMWLKHSMPQHILCGALAKYAWNWSATCSSLS